MFHNPIQQSTGFDGGGLNRVHAKTTLEPKFLISSRFSYVSIHEPANCFLPSVSEGLDMHPSMAKVFRGYDTYKIRVGSPGID